MNFLQRCLNTPARVGVASIVGVWVTGATSAPFTTVLYQRYGMSPDEALVIRSFCCILVALMIGRGVAVRATRAIVWSGLVMSLSSVFYYRVLSEWKVIPTTAMLSLIPLVNVALVWWRGIRPSLPVLLCAVAIVGGTFLALEPWHAHLSVSGWIYGILAVLTSAYGFDMWSRLPSETKISQQVFWFCVWVLVDIVAITIASGSSPMTGHATSSSMGWFYLIAYCVTVTGYIFTSVVPFNPIGKMDVVHANLLMALATPIILAGTKLIAHEDAGPNQLAGICIALIAGTYTSIDSVRSKPSAQSG